MRGNLREEGREEGDITDERSIRESILTWGEREREKTKNVKTPISFFTVHTCTKTVDVVLRSKFCELKSKIFPIGIINFIGQSYKI